METKVFSETEETTTFNFYCANTLSPAKCRMKRTFDIVGSIVGLIILSPVFLLIYIAIKWEDRGPVIFKQERIGYLGRPFTMFKFRSMITEAEASGKPQLCRKGDHRLTRTGRILRDRHLDELPQLWNVLKGDMSFVGPRPERRFFVDQITAITPSYKQLYRLRPGLFSIATLYNGYTDTLEKMLERLRMDLEYLSTWSLWLDAKIIVLTVISILAGRKI